MSTNDYSAGGGPAFPANHFDLAQGEHGLSIRDYFAAKAMQGMAGCHGLWPDPRDMQEISRRAYLMADAMLRARSATEGERS